MPNVMLIGDPHVTVDELQDSQRLIDLILESIPKHAVDEVIFLGDQYHQHAVVRVEVMNFWHRALNDINAALGRTPYLITGNHDIPGTAGISDSALIAHSYQANVVSIPTTMQGPDGTWLLVPFYHDHQDLIEASQERRSATTLVCHAELAGSKYDNGFYAPHGCNPDLLAQKTIISGHIHTAQEFGRVWYPGAPRWRTLSDANQDRAIYVVTPTERIAIDTSKYCRPIKALTFDQEGPDQLPDDANYHLTLTGTQKEVDAMVKRYRRPGVRIQTKPTTLKTAAVKESDGIQTAFQKHVQAYRGKYQTSVTDLAKMAQERL